MEKVKKWKSLKNNEMLKTFFMSKTRRKWLKCMNDREEEEEKSVKICSNRMSDKHLSETTLEQWFPTEVRAAH